MYGGGRVIKIFGIFSEVSFVKEGVFSKFLRKIKKKKYDFNLIFCFICVNL